MEATERADWADRLMVVARYRPPTRPPKAEDVSDDEKNFYKAVGYLLVYGPNTRWTWNCDIVEPLEPIFTLLAPDETDCKAQAQAVLQRVADVVGDLPEGSIPEGRSPEFWKRVLTEIATFESKVAEGIEGKPGSRNHRLVKEFAELLAITVNRSGNDYELSVEETEPVGLAHPSERVESASDLCPGHQESKPEGAEKPNNTSEPSIVRKIALAWDRQRESDENEERFRRLAYPDTDFVYLPNYGDGTRTEHVSNEGYVEIQSNGHQRVIDGVWGVPGTPGTPVIEVVLDLRITLVIFGYMPTVGIEIKGDDVAWYSALSRAKTGGLLPTIAVTLRAFRTEEALRCEADMIEATKKTLLTIISQIAAIGVQHFWTIFRRPLTIAWLIQNVLSLSWINGPRSGGIVVWGIAPNAENGCPIYLPQQACEELERLSQKPLDRLFQEPMIGSDNLPISIIKHRYIPGLIMRWLVADHPPELFAQAGQFPHRTDTWIVLSPMSDEDRQGWYGLKVHD